MTTDLQEALHRAVDDRHPDLARITDAARRRGLGMRRRRQTLATVGSLVAAGALAVGGVQLLGPGAPPVADGPAPARLSPTPRFDPADGTRPLTGAATAAGLRDVVASLQAGTAAHLAGQPKYGELRWYPADGSGTTDLGLNVQPRADYDGSPSCAADALRCRVVVRHGTRLVTQEQRLTTPAGRVVRVYVDYYRRDGIRVSVQAVNGVDLGGNRWRVTRSRPALSVEQLTTIVKQPWWGPRLPTALVEEGEQLASYTDLDERSAGQWLHGSADAETDQ